MSAAWPVCSFHRTKRPAYRVGIGQSATLKSSRSGLTADGISLCAGTGSWRDSPAAEVYMFGDGASPSPRLHRHRVGLG